MDQNAYIPNHPSRETRAKNEAIFSKLNYKQAVLATLAYFDIFNHPLTRNEVIRYLYKLEPDPHHVEVTLNESRLIERRGSYYQLSGDKDHISTRHDREIIAKKLWKQVNRYRWAFNITPYIKLVAICNNLAINNPSQTSDIDLLIITKPGRLFISRMIITFWLQLCGVRRHGGKVAGRFCLSFFATENNLHCAELDKKPHDIYLAYWLQTLQPICGTREAYEQLLNDNHDWAKQFFQQPPRYNMHHFKEAPTWAKHLKNSQEIILNTKLGGKIEARLQQWQLKRAHSKKSKLTTEETDVIATPNMLKFHNVDKRNEIYKTWVNKLTVILNTTSSLQPSGSSKNHL